MLKVAYYPLKHLQTNDHEFVFPSNVPAKRRIFSRYN